MDGQKDFEIKQNKLVKYLGSGGTITIPEGVTDIGDEAFFKNICWEKCQ